MFLIFRSEQMQTDSHIAKTSEASRLRRTSTSCSAFTLVETILALAVMAIGLLGTLVLFPVGLDATRTASDNTEVATIAAEYIGKFQQAALYSSGYINGGTNQDVFAQADSYPIITNDTGAYYFGHISVRNAGFPASFSQISYNIAGIPTNTISRVTIELWRRGANTNTFVTEVARYALP